MSLLVVGSVAFDAIETPFGKVDRMLGGAASYFALAASLFTPVRSGRRRRRRLYDEADEAVFAHQRIDFAGLERAAGKTFFWAGRYSPNMNERTTLATELNVFADFQSQTAAVIHGFALRFSRQYRSHAAALRLKQIRGKPQARGAGHHELLDRAHSGGIAGDAETHASADDQRRRDSPADRRAQSAARGETHFQHGPAKLW